MAELIVNDNNDNTEQINNDDNIAENTENTEKINNDDNNDDITDNTENDKPTDNDIENLNIPVRKMSRPQRREIINKYLENNNHPHYDIYKNADGNVTIHRKKQTVIQNLRETYPNATLSDTQMLQAQLIDLERKYCRLEQKHRKLKKRVNIIDAETIVVSDDDVKHSSVDSSDFNNNNADDNVSSSDFNNNINNINNNANAFSANTVNTMAYYPRRKKSLMSLFR